MIFLIQYPYSKRVATQIIAPISSVVFLLVATLYIDDTDLYIFNSGADSTEEVVRKVWVLLDTWHEVLKIMGGDLKLLKYY